MTRTLNLVNPQDKESCGFVLGKYPDGQQYVTIKDWQLLNLDEPIVIKSRLNTFLDLELIICANQALLEIGAKDVHLFIPYCIGGRSDRKFESGGINYIKKVIAPILNSQNFGKVTVMDPHSDVLEACINNFASFNNYSLVKMALTDIDNKDNAQNRIVLVSPDAGAYKKIFGVAQYFNIGKIVTATKVRDLKTGKILATEVPNLPISTTEEELRYVIVDDICDGGRTFIELAKVIREQRPKAEIYLVVTHGIFSGGFDYLMQHIDRIYTTNSVKDIEGGVDCPEILGMPYVKQLNVF